MLKECVATDRPAIIEFNSYEHAAKGVMGMANDAWDRYSATPTSYRDWQIATALTQMFDVAFAVADRPNRAKYHFVQ